MENDNFVKVFRKRDTDYVVKCPFVDKKFVFMGSKKNRKPTVVKVPREVYDWLVTETTAFKSGSLSVEEDMEEDLGMSVDLEEVKKNSHTREEIEKILKGTCANMKKKLVEITSQDEKDFVMSIAKEMKIDSTEKKKILRKFAGIPESVVLEDIFNE